jgi:hypothetical protein
MTLGEITQQEARAAAEIDHHRTGRQRRSDASREECPEVRPVSLRMGLHHAPEKILVR